MLVEKGRMAKDGSVRCELLGWRPSLDRALRSVEGCIRDADAPSMWNAGGRRILR
jgi:hypothetical protein